MNYLLIAVGILAVMILLTNAFPDRGAQKKGPGKTCRNCPEFRYCSGGKPRCPRRNGTLK